jgi:hypothetical protein
MHVVRLSRKPLFPGIYTPVNITNNAPLIQAIADAKKAGCARWVCGCGCVGVWVGGQTGGTQGCVCSSGRTDGRTGQRAAGQHKGAVLTSSRVRVCVCVCVPVCCPIITPHTRARRGQAYVAAFLAKSEKVLAEEAAAAAAAAAAHSGEGGQQQQHREPDAAAAGAEQQQAASAADGLFEVGTFAQVHTMMTGDTPESAQLLLLGHRRLKREAVVSEQRRGGGGGGGAGVCCARRLRTRRLPVLLPRCVVLHTLPCVPPPFDNHHARARRKQIPPTHPPHTPHPHPHRCPRTRCVWRCRT